MVRPLAFLRAPLFAAAAQILPIAPEDIALLGFALLVWIRDICAATGCERPVWPASFMLLATNRTLPIVVQPQHLSFRQSETGRSLDLKCSKLPFFSKD